MALAQVKRVLKLGGSLTIVLPSSWVKAAKEMVFIGNGELCIFPVHVKDSQVQEGETLQNGTESRH